MNLQACPEFFFNVGPPKEDIFPGHLLCPIFQSSYMLQFTNKENKMFIPVWMEI